MRNNSNVRFYVIIPVYKAENYVSECLDSVLSQTYQNFKIIAVDDGSPDNSGDICDKYALKDDRITVVHKQNEGQLSARSAGINLVLKECSENDFVVFLDSDDYLSINALEIINSAICRNDCDMVVYSIQRVFEGKYVADFSQTKPFVGTVDNKKELYNIVFNDFQYNSLCRKAISVKLLSQTDNSKYYHIRFGEDLLQCLPIYQKCKKAAFIPDVLYNYTFNPASVTSSISFETFEVENTVRYEIYKFLKSENVWGKEDFEKYMSYCRNLLASDIKRICFFDVPFSKKLELFKTINADEYYSIVLKDVPRKEVFLFAFKKQQYRLLVGYATIRKLIGKLYHKIFG